MYLKFSSFSLFSISKADLEDWAEEDPGGWEEIDTEQTKLMIREKRREMRNQRQKSTKTNGIDQQSPKHDIGIVATGLPATQTNIHQQA